MQGLFVKLPVGDPAASMRFFESLGFAFNPAFTDVSAACLILGPQYQAMLLTHRRFADFTPYRRVDAHRETQVLVALQLDSRARVEAMTARAQAAGGRLFRSAEDHGWMYSHVFQDLDGHIWEPFHMDPAALQAARANNPTAGAV